MFPNAPLKTGTSDERKIRRLYQSLNDQDKASLLSFAEFLNERSQPNGADTQAPLPEPQLIPRPEQESVVKAIKRLTVSYPMVAREKLLDQTSSLMAAHVLQGRTAPDVIDELEALFADHYEQMKQAHDAELDDKVQQE